MDLFTPIVSAVSISFDFAVRKINLLMNSNETAQDVVDELKKLTDKRDDLKSKIEAEEFRGFRIKNQVKGWMVRAGVVEAETRSIIDDLSQRSCCLADCPSVCRNTSRLLKKLNEINELSNAGDFDTIIENGSCRVVEEIPSKAAIGLDAMLKKAFDYLEEDGVGIIGIYGMGGVGKTTLLKNINNEFLTRTHEFDVVIWVLVSKDFVADKIQRSVEERLGLSSEETEDSVQRASNIYRILRTKRFLLLLDDVWEGIDLEKIGIPIPDRNNNSKVIFTSRSMDVCSDMDADRKLKVEFLGNKESWQLFCEKLGGEDILESKAIWRCAETIVRKCGGLPLALITIGRAMSNKETEEEWKCAIEEFDKCPSEIRGMTDIFILLKFSYDNLENDVLRSCFVYCSLFPEDYCIEKEQLIEYWIGEGFINSSSPDLGRSHAKGHSVIGSLKVACLLEAGAEQTEVKMHDVVRSFALWVVSHSRQNKQFLVEASAGLTEAPKPENWEHVERISLIDNGITAMPEIPICSGLLTLLLQWNNGLSKISDGFFRHMPVLRVLDLSFTSIREIPASIANLLHLHHLDLSGTKVTALPKELGNLGYLRHLDLQRTRYLRIVPRESILRLHNLTVLNLYYSYENWETNDHGIQVSDLGGLGNLTILGITITEFDTLVKLSRSGSLLRCIQYLYIKECEGLFHLHLSSNEINGNWLRRLSINNCYNLEYLVTGGGGPAQSCLNSLEVLALYGLPNLSTVWRSPVAADCLQSLRTLNIWYCHKLRNLSWILQLPNLETVYLFYCSELEELVGRDDIMEEENPVAFPSLRTLSIRDLPGLQRLTPCDLTFPCLESVAIIDCPKLHKLSIKVSSHGSTPMIYGTSEWWDGLEWDDDITRSSFLPNFMPI